MEPDEPSMPLAEAMMTQRAIRRLRPDPVDDELVVRCVELALRAPTGSNGQNWEFVAVRDRDVIAGFGAQYRAAWPMGRREVENEPNMAKVLAAVDWLVDHFDEVPVLVVACLDDPSPPGSGDPPLRHSSFYGSIYPSVQNLLLAARGFGLGATLITLPLWSLSVARRLLGLPDHVTPVCVVPMGWPQGGYGPTTRRPVGDVLHLDRYGNRPWL